tara:strand:+ start:489 stop:1487 length:999 start_codon:yes stop_codon:yes gene_type:complete
MKKLDTQKEIDFIDFLNILWRKKIVFFIIFIVSLITIFLFSTIFKLSYTNYSFTIVFKIEEKNHKLLELDKLDGLIKSNLPDELTFDQFEDQLNNEYYINRNFYTDKINNIALEENYETNINNFLLSLSNINRAEFLKEKNKLIVTSNSRIYNHDVDSSLEKKIKNILIDQYLSMTDIISQKHIQSNIKTYNKLNQHFDNLILELEGEIKIANEKINLLNKKLEKFNNLINNDVYWNNFVSVENNLNNMTTSSENKITKLNYLKDRKKQFQDYYSNLSFNISILNYMTNLNRSDSLASNNIILSAFAFLISLFIGILTIYLQSEILRKRNNK